MREKKSRTRRSGPQQRRRKKDPLAGKRHPPFGATKAQSKTAQATRDLKNRIHELEQDKAALLLTIDNYKGREMEYMRRVLVRTPGKHQIDALAAIAAMPVKVAAAAGIMQPAVVIVEWVESLQDKPVEKLSYREAMADIASGKRVLFEQVQ